MPRHHSSCAMTSGIKCFFAFWSTHKNVGSCTHAPRNKHGLADRAIFFNDILMPWRKRPSTSFSMHQKAFLHSVNIVRFKFCGVVRNIIHHGKFSSGIPKRGKPCLPHKVRYHVAVGKSKVHPACQSSEILLALA